MVHRKKEGIYVCRIEFVALATVRLKLAKALLVVAMRPWNRPIARAILVPLLRSTTIEL